MPNTQWVIDLFHVKLKDPEHKKEQNQLMLKRLFKYIDNNNLSLTYVALTDSPHVSGLTQPLMKLLVALGIEMAKYYSPCKQSVYTSLPG